jgi:hypothetical protein
MTLSEGTRSTTTAGEGITRFIGGRLSNGHHGVFDTLLELYVVRDVARTFADRVAERLNQPGTWEPTEPQHVADAVRLALETTTPTPPTLVH